jgi:hypothetical protein
MIQPFRSEKLTGYRSRKYAKRYIVAGQRSFRCHGEVEIGDLLAAIAALRRETANRYGRRQKHGGKRCDTLAARNYSANL